MPIVTQESLVDSLNKLPHKSVVITTGGGTGVFQALLSRGNGSNTLLAGYVPYSEKETIGFLGKTPEKMVSCETARALAMVAYQKALKLKDGDYEVMGVACTASLQRVPTEREGRLHTIYVALQTRNMTHTMSLVIKDSFHTLGLTNLNAIRAKEEQLAVGMMLNELANGHDLELQVVMDEYAKQDIEYDWFENEKLGDILAGKIKYYGFFGDEPIALKDYVDSRTAIFPGSFNPAHEGHREMMEIIAGKDCKVIREISLTNVDKPPIDFISMRNRLMQKGWQEPVLVTNAPTFVDKSRLFPGARFIVGGDTLIRILNPKYAGEIAHVRAMLEGNNNYFYIFPRGDGKSLGLWGEGSTVLPGEFIVEPRQYEHVSSTELRKKT